MLEFMDYIVDGIECFFQYILRGIIMILIVVTTPIWILPYKVIKIILKK